jgi:glycerol-3-phosphate dehydrogenase
VIGAGIVGAAIARDLAGTSLSVAVIEARSDVGDATSKANTALLHTGYDATPGTLESRLVARGHHLLGDYAARTGIPVERTGALLVAWTAEELQTLPALKDKAERNGYHDCSIIGAAEVYRQVPDLGPGALGGLTVPGESIISTWTANLALANDAVHRGATLLREHAVTGAAVSDGISTVHTSRGDVTARWVINAAGLGADWIDQEFGYHRFTVTPRRGELLVFDKQARPLAPKIILPVPSSRGKGVLISPTIYGNVMLGPTSEDLQDRTATGTSEAGFDFLLGKGRTLMPRLLAEEVTASYAGLRAAIDHKDYLIEIDPARRYLLVGGIRSTGLTSGMAIAEHVHGLLAEAGLDLTERPGLPTPPKMPNIGEAFTRPYQDAALIEKDPAYGRIVCFCERVTAGEIRDAYSSAIPPPRRKGCGAGPAP